MSELLLEIFSEEIPARMQKRAMEDLTKLISDGLAKSGVNIETKESWVAPRRLGLAFTGLPIATPDVKEEKKGPKTSAPQAAIDGFVKAAGINNISEARIVQDDKKGDFYIVDIVKNGVKTTDLISELVPQVVRNFPWPKSMRWGEGTLRWVRPLHSIICLFDGQVVDFEIDGLESGNKTEGHRFHSKGEIIVKDFADYKAKLSAANVVIDREDRKADILKQAEAICAANNLELVSDIGLLEEVCGLIDKPVVILGDVDKSFLDLPPEVIRLTLRLNQKYFVANDKTTGKLAPHFIVVSNIAATDGGKAIAHGNARVLAARLNDARYFWDLDKKSTLESRLPKLDKIVFHQKIGSIGDKVKRITELAGEIAPIVGADVELSKRAALLAKADLVTEMVGEFPELQGIMGRYYAKNDGENALVADAIAEHYKPIGPSDNVPTKPVSIAAALADKIDTLVSFFAIGEKPTGGGDPYALRRAALGVIRIILENNIKFSLGSYLGTELMSFFQDRFKVYLRDEGLAHDVIDAVFANSEDDFLNVYNKIKYLSEFLKTMEGKDLVAGYKRAANILNAETKKEALDLNTAINSAIFNTSQERELFTAINAVSEALDNSLSQFNYSFALAKLSELKSPVYSFLDGVLVNDSDKNIRLNRLLILYKLKELMARFADFSTLQG